MGSTPLNLLRERIVELYVSWSRQTLPLDKKKKKKKYNKISWNVKPSNYTNMGECALTGYACKLIHVNFDHWTWKQKRKMTIIENIRQKKESMLRLLQDEKTCLSKIRTSKFFGYSRNLVLEPLLNILGWVESHFTIAKCCDMQRQVHILEKAHKKGFFLKKDINLILCLSQGINLILCSSQGFFILFIYFWLLCTF